MIFIALLIALVLFQVRDIYTAVQRDDWYSRFQGTIRGLGLSPAVTLLLSIGTPLVRAWLVLDVLDSILFGLPWILGAVAILLYSLGRVEIDGLYDRYRSFCLSGDFEGASRFAESELSVDFPVEESEAPTPNALHDSVLGELLYGGFQRWFTVVFYFVLFGPLGALCYRLFQLSVSSPEGRLATRGLFFLDWIPTRLLAAGFAVTGDFLASRDELLATISDPDTDARSVLLTVGRAAIQTDPASDRSDIGEDSAVSDSMAGEVMQLKALVSRSAAAWVFVIAFAVLVL